MNVAGEGHGREDEGLDEGRRHVHGGGQLGEEGVLRLLVEIGDARLEVARAQVVGDVLQVVQYLLEEVGHLLQTLVLPQPVVDILGQPGAIPQVLAQWMTEVVIVANFLQNGDQPLETTVNEFSVVWNVIGALSDVYVLLLLAGEEQTVEIQKRQGGQRVGEF